MTRYRKLRILTYVLEISVAIYLFVNFGFGKGILYVVGYSVICTVYLVLGMEHAKHKMRLLYDYLKEKENETN